MNVPIISMNKAVRSYYLSSIFYRWCKTLIRTYDVARLLFGRGLCPPINFFRWSDHTGIELYIDTHIRCILVCIKL